MTYQAGRLSRLLPLSSDICGTTARRHRSYWALSAVGSGGRRRWAMVLAAFRINIVFVEIGEWGKWSSGRLLIFNTGSVGDSRGGGSGGSSE